VAVYHGPDRNLSRAWLAQQDVVITTYATLAGDVGARGGSGLFGQQWLRVVLDEAHTIRNSETQQAKVSSLRLMNEVFARDPTVMMRTRDAAPCLLPFG
jgi:replicative superfamily II helicase